MPIERSGPVTLGTRRNLINGLRGKPMSEQAVDATLAQSFAFAETFLRSYEQNVAVGEVGPGGTARASEEDILGDSPQSVLLYGRVQSGKTAAMVLTSALCFDNGFRVIVVLTTDNVALVAQTANRFKAVDGPRVFSTILNGDGYDWDGQEDELREDIATEGLILVCAKNDLHLSRVLEFLQNIDAPAYPTLVFDDEADAATPDTTAAARSSGRANAPLHPSTIHRRVIENQKPGQEGESIGEIFPHQLYVQVTATPYIFFLQRTTSAIRPTETLLLEPGEGYCGGEVFFEAFDPSDPMPPAPPLVLVGDNELQSIPRRKTPTGLAASIDYFLLAAVAKAQADGAWPTEGFNHLSHPSASTGQHAFVASHIEKHVGHVRRELRVDRAGVLERLRPAYDELRRTIDDPPSLEVLVDLLKDAIRQVEVIRINSIAAPLRPGPRLNFLVGGNILGRGLTIDDLLVTYYVRQAKTSQMDTVWQHARMYGYRRPLLAYTRVYLPRVVATNFKGIHDAEVALRDLVARDGAAAEPVIMLPANTRATRKNAIETDFPRVIEAGLAQLAPRHVVTDAGAAAEIRDRLLRLGVPLDIADRDARLTRVPLDEILELIACAPVRQQDPGKWTPGVATAIIETYRDKYVERGSEGKVYVRELEGADDRERARLSGQEVSLIRRGADGVPALVLLWVGTAAEPHAWYPTLVMPSNSKAYIFPPE
jgi:hypothetical protein